MKLKIFHHEAKKPVLIETPRKDLTPDILAEGLAELGFVSNLPAFKETNWYEKIMDGLIYFNPAVLYGSLQILNFNDEVVEDETSEDDT